jgi:glutaredoxin 2
VSKQKSNAASTQTVKNLALYHYQSCPFCGIAREAIKFMDGLNIEQRDILKVPVYRKELVQGGGKPQVPCLKIETNNGTIEWLYESRDIIQYLKRHDAALTETA